MARSAATAATPGPLGAGEGGVAAAGVDVGRLFDAHAPFLLRVVARLTGAGDHVEDLVQEVFLTAHRRRGELDPGTDLRGWLYRVAVNLVQHHRRSFARRRALQDKAQAQVPEEGPAGPDTLAARREQALRIRACLERLPLKQREVFVLFELEELEGRQISELLDIPENTVWSRLHHARERFRRLWPTVEAYPSPTEVP